MGEPRQELGYRLARGSERVVERPEYERLISHAGKLEESARNRTRRNDDSKTRADARNGPHQDAENM